MQVTIERSGGFAGIRAVWKVDSATLADSDAQALRQLADALLADDPPGRASAMPDAFCHLITVETEHRRCCVKLQADPLPEAACALIDWVKTKAQR